MPSFHAAASSRLFALFGSYVNIFSIVSSRAQTPSESGPTEAWCTPKNTLSTIDFRSMAQFAASRTARSSVGAFVTFIENPSVWLARGDSTNVKRLSSFRRL